MKMQRMQRERRMTSIHQKSVISFDELTSEFIDEQRAKGNAPATIKHYEQSIRKLKMFITLHTYGEKEYRKLTHDEIVIQGGQVSCSVFDKKGIDAAYRLFLSENEGLNAQTVSTYFRDYRVIMYYAMDDGIVQPRSITVKSTEVGVKDVYSNEELDKLLTKPNENCSFCEYRNWVVVNYLLATGNRVGTIVNLRIRDIDFDDGMIAINTQKSKKKTRIPMERKNLAQILRTYIDEWLVDSDGNYTSEYLFPSSYIENDRPMTRESMGRAIACYNKNRGVKKTSIHLFRHTFVKNWILSGGDLHSLQKILGHSTLDMVVHYANLYEKDLSDKVDNFSTLSLRSTDQFCHVQRKRLHKASE